MSSIRSLQQPGQSLGLAGKLAFARLSGCLIGWLAGLGWLAVGLRAGWLAMAGIGHQSPLDIRKTKFAQIATVVLGESLARFCCKLQRFCSHEESQNVSCDRGAKLRGPGGQLGSWMLGWPALWQGRHLKKFAFAWPNVDEAACHTRPNIVNLHVGLHLILAADPNKSARVYHML